MGFGGWLSESASSIAHVRRNQGILWSWALNVWATHLYYQNLDKHALDVSVLPLDVFNTIRGLITNRDEWQVVDELSHVYPQGISKTELLATLDHLYVVKREKGREPAFVRLVSTKGNFEEDIRLVKWLVLYCEPMALSIPPASMDELVDEVERAFKQLGIPGRSFTKSERTYLQLHLLVCFHNVLLDVRSDVFNAITHQDPPHREAMLSVSAMDDTLGLDIAFYHLDGGVLDQSDLRSPDRFERFRCPLVTTDLDESAYLLESDQNIRCCLFNHPLEVRKRSDRPVIVALQRKNAQFKPTFSRYEPRTF